MSLRWLWFAYLPPGRRIASRVKLEIYRRAFDPDRPPLWSALLPVPLLLAIVVGPLVLVVLIVEGGLISAAALGLAMWLGLAVAGLWVVGPGVRRAVGVVQRERCLACDYPFRGLPESRTSCPECGRASQCHACGHSLQGLAHVRYCPECGENQRWVPPPPNIRWLVCQYVDPALPLSRTQLADARRCGVRQTGGRRQVVAITLTIALTLGLFFAAIWAMGRSVIIEMILSGSGELVLLSYPLWIAITAVVWWVVITLLARWTYAPAVRAAVGRLGHEVCPGCGHWVREAETEFRRCIECGTGRS